MRSKSTYWSSSLCLPLSDMWYKWLRLSLVIYFTLCSSLYADDRANASFYVDTFGTVDRELSPYVSRAHRIFDNLKRASSVNTFSARLVIIDAEGKPWAIALADGNVVLSHGALEIIYQSVEPETGDAWLAFVLGHELAHLGSRDLWQQHVFASLSALPKDESSLADVQQSMFNTVFDAQAWREKELKADELGYVIASLAGYEVDKIFKERNNFDDFLTVWEAQTQTSGNTHYRAAIRTDFLRMRMERASRKAEQFQLGVLLSHFGNYKDALTVLEDFQSYFPSRQVLTNLGYVHLQFARQSMPETLAYRFWFPLLLEADSGLRLPSRSVNSDMLPSAAEAHLWQSVRYLERALTLNNRSVKSSINLAVAYHYLGKYFRARAVIEDALEVTPENPWLLMLRSIILVDQEPGVDMWPRALANLESISPAGDISLPLLYNNMQLQIERGRHGRALKLAGDILRNNSAFPAAYRKRVCLVLSQPCLEKAGKNGFPVSVNRREIRILPGDALVDKGIREVLEKSSVYDWRIQAIEGTTVQYEGTTAYAIEGVVEYVRHTIAEEDLQIALPAVEPETFRGFAGWQTGIPGIQFVESAKNDDSELWLTNILGN